MANLFLLNLLFVATFIFIIHSLGGISYLLFKMRNKGVAGVYEHRKNLFQQIPMQKDAIVFLGNSIIEQCEWQELFQNEKIINRGIAGDVSEGILNRIDKILEDQPTQLFLMIGINDLFFKGEKRLLENYPKILQQIKEKSPSTAIFIHSMLPVNTKVRNIPIANELIVKTNQSIQTIATQYGATYINLHDLLKDETGNLDAKYTNDGIHINGSAYMIWKETISGLVLTY